MAVNFTRLFTALGKVCGALNEINTYRATTLAGRLTTLVSQFSTTAIFGPLVSDLYTAIASAKQSEDSYAAYLGTLADAILLAEVNADRALTDTGRAAVLAELERQMLVAGETLNDCPSTVTIATVSATGDHTVVYTRHEALTGLVSDYMVPDIYLMELTNNRSTGGTLWGEVFSCVGKPADSLPTDSTYPTGTGINTTLTAIDPGSDFGIVDDGDFDEWGGTGNNTPTNWTVYGSTVAGTHVTRATDDPRSAIAVGYSLQFTGDGTVVPKVRQAVTVTANTVYAVHARVKKSADPGTDWGVSILLTDATGAALAGNGSYSNIATSVTAASVASTWANTITGTFCTPKTLPSTGVYLEIRFHQFGATSTAPANTASAIVDHVSVQEATPLYAGGPSLTIFSGYTEGVIDDARTATVALSSGVPSTYLIRGIDRLLGGGLASAAVRIPTLAGGSETQADALVT